MKFIDRSALLAMTGAAALALILAGGAHAYDGTNCKAPGNCWEPKPGYPDKVAGSKYDPKHDPKELNKQSESIKGMEARNAQRVEYFKKTGQFVYDVSKIPSSN
ncbi:methanol dehydrogenase [cytochrome c] subunit [Bosea sp. 117]|uniref:methanol dehydrogenase [cytochrome c] subunit n=1 Tax=Bosea sp. 117 TaxID=1125973 RepID=UPI000494536E|nr:methanol dehydrogenase [cytochrome c] subunit [Bosea sp. 117]